MGSSRTFKKPLNKSVAKVCIIYTVLLCVSLCVLNYFMQRNALYKRYEQYISDILYYVDHHIDDEDLFNCIETNTESEKYKQTLLFMDQIMNDFSIHYLYCLQPINLNETGNVKVILSAEDDYNRYVDTEGNLYLGWVSDDEYDLATVKKFYQIMDKEEITFFIEKTEWSTDYTGALPLRTEEGIPYAILCVDVDVTTLYNEILAKALQNAIVIILFGAAFTTIFLFWTTQNIINPVQLLEKGVAEFVQKSHGTRDIENLKFDEPDIHTDNEVESLSHAVTQMTEDMQDYVTDILHAEQEAATVKQREAQMRTLANSDALTGIRNKTAYDKELEKLAIELDFNEDYIFGIGMIDLNFLKKINDTYGHSKGDAAIKRLSGIVCTVFAHSPVFRIGGDEFAVVLRGQDYENRDQLKDLFIEMTSGYEDKSDTVYLDPWDQISAAIGIASYDKTIDRTVEDVFKRADNAMYEMKKAMKAERKD
ncbi:MAG: GGDEF domain-containing protein [Butyrivibrio sp.]|nr:GGDEF domain-containing protein [Butyrivibrio sp.]